MRQQALTVVGQTDAAGRSMKQAGLEMLLQLSDLAAHRRLADPALARDGGERPRLDDPDETAKRVNQVHVPPLVAEIWMLQLLPTRGWGAYCRSQGDDAKSRSKIDE